MAQAQLFTLPCQGVPRAMEESDSQGMLLIEDSTEGRTLADYSCGRMHHLGPATRYKCVLSARRQ